MTYVWVGIIVLFFIGLYIGYLIGLARGEKPAFDRGFEQGKTSARTSKKTSGDNDESIQAGGISAAGIPSDIKSLEELPTGYYRTLGYCREEGTENWFSVLLFPDKSQHTLRTRTRPYLPGFVVDFNRSVIPSSRTLKPDALPAPEASAVDEGKGEGGVEAPPRPGLTFVDDSYERNPGSGSATRVA